MLSLPPPRSILHLDADAFFASVEQRDDPRLRGKPVAVGTGVVASCSYESRRFGVRTGMRLAEARRLCRSLIIIPGDYRRYEQAARRMLAISLERTPVVEVPALDDIYLDLTRCAPQADLVRVADGLRAQIRDEVGLGVSVGIGGNKLVAKVATRQAKPGGRVLVPMGTERAYLAPWPVRVLPGVGPKTAYRLDRLNVTRVGELAVVPRDILVGLFGKVGRTLHDQANGIDLRPVNPHETVLQQSVSRRTSFEPATADMTFLHAMLDHLMERVCSWLRQNDRACKGVGVVLNYGDYESLTGRTSFRRATDSEGELKAAAHDRFERLYQRRLPLRLLGVELSPIVSPDPQPMLFVDPEEERSERLLECKDAIRRRFGFMAVLNGTALVLADRLEQDRENFRLRTPCLTR